MAVNIFVTLQKPTAQGLPANVITGDITFEARSFAWGANNTVSIGPATQGAAAGAGKARFSEASLTKIVDHAASPLLFQLLTMGGHLDMVRVDFRKAGGPGPGLPGHPAGESWVTINFRTVFVTNLSQSVASGDEDLQEVVSLAFGGVQVTINGMDSTGKITAGRPVSWNQVTNNPAWDVVMNPPA